MSTTKSSSAASVQSSKYVGIMGILAFANHELFLSWDADAKSPLNDYLRDHTTSSISERLWKQGGKAKQGGRKTHVGQKQDYLKEWQTKWEDMDKK
ncbi:hypothetical protein HJFPF1_05766 [Paramyrothecium foliicola]|nr:hypothetical protein HJFPF1_05766 [Paramyrothecium foliicola]